MTRSRFNERVLITLRSAATPLTADRIAEIVYADDPTGGPVNAGNMIRQTIGLLRAQGHQIQATAGRIGGYTYHGYRRPRSGVDTVKQRRRRVAELHAQGLSVLEIAVRVGVGRATICHDLKANRGLQSAQVAA